MKLRVLIVGAGMYVCGRGTTGFGTILPTVYEAYRDGLIEKVCVAATNPSSIKSLQEKVKGLNRVMGVTLPIEGFPQEKPDPYAYKKLLSSFEPHCAIVTVPDHLHFRTTVEIMRKNVHALVMKPLVPTLREARLLIRYARKHNVYGAVEFHKRFDEANMKLRHLILAKKLGDLLYIDVNYSQRKSIPERLFKNWANKTDIFQYLGVHYADVIYFCTGATPLRVMATGQKKWLVKKGINTYDAIQAVVEWGNKITGQKFISTIHTNWIDPDDTSAMSDQRISVVGTEGRYDSDQKNRGVQIVTDREGIEDFNPYFSQFFVDGTGKIIFRGYGKRSIYQFLNDTLDIASGHKQPMDLYGLRPTFEEALVSTAIIEAVHRSLKKNNSWVSISQLRKVRRD